MTAAAQARRRRIIWIVVGVGGLLVVCCGGAVAIAALVPTGAVRSVSPAVAASSPAPTSGPAVASPAPSTVIPTASQTTSPPDRIICQASNADGGTFYLLVTSAAYHEFELCAGLPRYAGTLDDLFKISGMDRRCILPDDYTAQHHAIVGAYSDQNQLNLAAAQRFCSAHGGTNG